MERHRAGAVPARAPDSAAAEEFWSRLRERSLRGQPDPRVARWLDRLEVVSLSGGVLVLAERSSSVAAWVRAHYARLFARAAEADLGVPVRVRIEKDRSLRGALAALGLPLAPRRRAPPFVVVPENELAHAAILRTAEAADTGWDRLLILGPPGVGKTHLTRLFLERRAAVHPEERWHRDTGIDFYREFSRTCRERRRAVLRERLQAMHGLVLDAVDGLAGKLQCQEFLADQLEHFQAQRRPVVITAQHLPASRREFVPHLRSLLLASNRITIPEPSAASRARLLEERSRAALVPAWVFDELGKVAARDVDATLRLLAEMQDFARSLGRAPGQDELLARFPGLSRHRQAADPMDRVIDRCAAFVGVSREALVSGARSRGAALGRHLAIYLAFEVFNLRIATVRRWLGRVSPSVVPYARRKITELRARDPRCDGFLREVAEEIERGQRFLFP